MQSGFFFHFLDVFSAFSPIKMLVFENSVILEYILLDQLRIYWYHIVWLFVFMGRCALRAAYFGVWKIQLAGTRLTVPGNWKGSKAMKALLA